MGGTRAGRRHRTALACALLLTGAGLAGRDVAPQEGWLRLTTPHFDVAGPAGEAGLRQVGERLERFRQALAQMLPPQALAAARPASVVVFPTHASYEPFKPLYEGRAKSLVEGHAVSAAGRTYMLLTTEGEAQLGVIYHEYVHVLLHSTMAGAPTWFDEGLAELYSTFEVTPDGRALIGAAPRTHVRLLRRQPLLPLTTLVAVDHASPLYNESDKASTFYAQSWALVHYLLLGNGGRDAPRLGSFVRRLAEGERIDTAVEALGTTVGQLERDLAAYIERETLPRQSIALGAPVASVDGAPVTPVTPAEAHATLGDALFLMGRAADAEAELRASLARDGSYAPAHAALGQLLAEHGRPGEARTHLERAIASPSATWLTHLAYATVLIEERPPAMESGPDDAAIERSLVRAMALNPAAAEPYGQLAWLKAQSPKTLDQAGALAEEAFTRAPGDDEIALLRAQVFVNTRRYADARPLLVRLTRANDASVRQQAGEILGRLDALAAATAGRTAEDVGLRMAPGAGPREGVLVFRALAPGERRLAGWLSSVSCSAEGVVFAGRTPDGSFAFRALRLGDVQLLTYSAGRRGLRCGERLERAAVVFTYTNGRLREAGLSGRAVAIEFPPPGYEVAVPRR
jgi:tetratricopeptide (TPR) repeat protein